MIKLHKLISLYINQENQCIRDNKTAIAAANRKFFKTMLEIGSACFVMLFFMTFLLSEYAPLRVTYIILIISFTAMVLVIDKFSDRTVMFLFYGIFSFMVGYSTFSSAILYPDYTEVFILAVLLEIPILILDNSLRITVFELLSLFLYLMIALPRKIPSLQQDEILNPITFCVEGMALGFYLRRVRLKNLDLIRQGIIRETTDVLTGLNNRRKLFDHFIEIEEGSTDKIITGISILDIDFFKTYNDTYGHLAGDKCLRAVGACLKKYGELNNMDFFRYGGEEFVGISYEQERVDMIRCFKNIVPAIEQLDITHENSQKGIVTVSQGVFPLNLLQQIKSVNIQSRSSEGQEEKEGNHMKGLCFQQFLSLADEALYKAKDQGRNRTIVYNN